MRPAAAPLERFNGWFASAIDKLKELPEGDGAFAALMIALPLYERYIIAKLKLSEQATEEEEIRREMGADLQLNDQDRRVFWAMFRTGFMHQAMVQSGRTQWLVSHHFEALPSIRIFHGVECVCMDPWKFADRVVKLFRSDPRLITASDSFPLADVFSVSSDAFEDREG